MLAMSLHNHRKHKETFQVDSAAGMPFWTKTKALSVTY